MYLNIKSEFSFRSVFSHVENIVKKCKEHSPFCGIADIGNTFSHVPLEKECLKQAIRPFFGVVIPVTFDLEEKNRRGHLNNVTLVAITQKGLPELYKIVELSQAQFWFTPRITYEQLEKVNKNNILVISGSAFSPEMEGVYQQVSPNTPIHGLYHDRKPIACIDNNYIDFDDKPTYELLADSPLLERKTSPQHILTHKEWLEWCKNKEAIANLKTIVNKAEKVVLQKAPLVKIDVEKPKKYLKTLCKNGAKERGISLKKEPYKSRFKKEISLISEKGFIDYFLIVQWLMSEAKKEMLVGPGRGSSGGSLVCFLLGITMIDPIKYGLIFERFIDINRSDLPDIDMDFQHDQRPKILKLLQEKYHVSPIANISRLTPKINLNRIAKNLHFPESKLSEIKSLTSDQKADSLGIREIFETTEQGMEFIKQNKQFHHAIKLENHALHSSIHAAGIIVSPSKITDFCGVDVRNNSAMIDMAGCEYLGLLKIDALALKTLTIIAKTLQYCLLPHDFIYSLKDGDKKTYKLINSGNLTGIFQLEGRAIKGVIEGVKIKSIEDIAIISAIGRPGPMIAGVDKSFRKRKNGEEFTLPDNHETIKEITKETYGLIIYQEQIMQIAREYAKMKWEDVILLRKTIAKSKGSEELQKFREMFIDGSVGENPAEIWDMIKNFGSYGFNKSHAIAYAIISYWCAYLKTHHLREFATALLNTSDNDNQSIEILRYLDKKEGIRHEFFSKHSALEWTFVDGKLHAPVTSIKGIGIVTGRKLIKDMENGRGIAPGVQKHLDRGETPFRFIYPRRQVYGDYRGINIEDIVHHGEYTIIVKLLKKKLKDANSLQAKNNRNGDEVDGPTTYINMIVADDTGDIMCIINRFDFVNIGDIVLNSGEEDKTWYQIKGEFFKNNNLFFVKEIKDITRHEQT